MFRVNGFVDGKEKPSSLADEGFSFLRVQTW